MEVVRRLSHHVDLSPDSFRGDVRETAQNQFSSELIGRCMKKHGEIVRIVRILSVTQQALTPSGAARFSVECDAVVFQVHVGDIMTATVLRADAIGAVLKNRCVDVYVPAQYLNGPVVAQSTIRVRVLALRHENNRFSAVAEVVT